MTPKEIIESIEQWEEIQDLGCRHTRIEKILEKGQMTKCPMCAYAVREIALKKGSDHKAKYQQIWLKHCMSPESDSFFHFFKGNPEDDVEALIKKGLDNGPLANAIGGEYINQYWKAIYRWYLKRYNFNRANNILKCRIPENEKNIFDKIALYYPRMWVAIIIGLLPLITQRDIWKLVNHLDFVQIVFSSLLFIFLSIGYLSYECYNVVHDSAVAFKRALFAGCRGILISIFLSLIICYFSGVFFTFDNISNNIKQSYFYDFSKGLSLYLLDSVFFASSALLIGIFIQIFWEEKTVTEPL